MAMDTPFDVKTLGRDLSDFQCKVSFYLTDDTPPPEEVSERLWKAHDLVVRVLGILEEHYGFRGEISWAALAQSRPPEGGL